MTTLKLCRERQALILLNWILIAVSCVSLIYVADYYREYHIHFRSSDVGGAIALIAAFALVSLLFAYADKSFGYVVGFYSYLMIAGYLWFNYFSELVYNHRLAGLSAAASAIAFLLPALLITSPVRQIYVLSQSALDRLLTAILLVGCATVLVGASYTFKFVRIADIYNYRSELGLPVILNYVIGIASNALLPFAFACFVGRRDFWRAGAVLFLLLLFYPITLSKLALFTPFWLVTMAALSRYLAFKFVVTVSLLVPIIVGLSLIILFQREILPYHATVPYFGLVNFRMIAIPSLAMEYYNSFFSNHPPTYFCQILLLKPFVSCPYQEQLANVIYNAFGIGGQFNASLFATEGIASAGSFFAPTTALVSGLVMALGNRLSAGLPPPFILISSAVIVQALLNVPLTTVVLSHGFAFLLLLWYVTPRDLLGLAANKRARQAKLLADG
jgi:hypothetical protein